MRNLGFSLRQAQARGFRVQGSVRKDEGGRLKAEGGKLKAEGGRRKAEGNRVADLGVPIHPSAFIPHPFGRGGGIARAVLVCAATLASSVAFSVVAARAQEVTASYPTSQATSKPAIRFTYVDVFIDSKDQPLAAYQFELAAEKGDVKIVGIEGGEHAAFKAPPYYDPAAMSRDHVIIAAFNTGKDLPKGKTRVARVHVQITGEPKPEYVIKLEVAASFKGQPISGATATVTEGGSR